MCLILYVNMTKGTTSVCYYSNTTYISPVLQFWQAPNSVFQKKMTQTKKLKIAVLSEDGS